MLKNSKILLHTCASTEGKEYNPIFFYIIRTVANSIHFSPNQKDNFKHKIIVGKYGFTNSTRIFYQVTENDYYSVRFSSISSDITLTYNLTMTIKQVDLDDVNSTWTGTTYDDGQSVGESIKLGTGKYCLFADIQDSSRLKTHNYTTLETHMQPRVGVVLGVTGILFLAFVIGGTLASALFVFFINKYCCPRVRGYSHID